MQQTPLNGYRTQWELTHQLRAAAVSFLVFFLRRELFFAIQKNNFNEAKKNLNEEWWELQI